MRKREIAEKIAAKFDVPVEDSVSVVNIIIDELGKELLDGKKLVVSNLGTFRLKSYPAYKTKPIINGKEAETHPYRLIRFKPSIKFLAYLKSKEHK